MSDLTLTKIRLRNGVWEGLLIGGTTGVRPEVQVTHRDQPLGSVALTETGQIGEWILSVPVPPEAIADGVQTMLIVNGADGRKLGHFTVIAGDTADDDLRAEIELLRAELDMLKRAFRRHCLETM